LTLLTGLRSLILILDFDLAAFLGVDMGVVV
jgi:hypothetical protein